MKKLLPRLAGLTIVITLAVTLALIPVSTAYAECRTAILPETWCEGTSGQGIISMLIFIRNILIALISVGAVGAFVFAGILYTTAGDNEEQVRKAKTLIKGAVIGLIVAGILVAASVLIMPGGIDVGD
ncbi:hypothetical protein FWD07_03240 [Candidatus Saccharibacteria bacterium]|nr:hypothetical protein [Candidatus Saccharibacteria bacterium]